MPLICVCSPNGGTGRTTIAANLVWSLARSGMKALAIDFNVQNTLRLHFGSHPNELTGYVSRSPDKSDWSQNVLTPGGSVFFLPFGQVTGSQRTAFEEGLNHDPDYIRRGLNTLLRYPGLTIVADVPAGPGAALRSLVSLADLVLVVLQPDPVSLSCLSMAQAGGSLTENVGGKEPGWGYVINQMDPRKRINNSVLAVMEQKLGQHILGTIHSDESVREACAQQTSVFDFNAVSAASFDIELLCKRVMTLLDLNVGDGTVASVPDFRITS